MMTAAQAAASGLELAARLDLPDDPLKAVAEQLAAGNRPSDLDTYLAKFESFAKREPKLAWVAFLLTGGQATRVAPAKAEVARRDLSNTIADLSTRLSDIHVLARAETQATMDLAVVAAGDRVGRMATGKIPSRELKREMASVDPWLVIAALGDRFASLNVNEERLVNDSLSEGIAVVRRNLRSRADEIITCVSDTFQVDFDPDPFVVPIETSVRHLEQRASEYLVGRLRSPETSTPGEVSRNPRTMPTGIIQCALEIAGGGTTTEMGQMQRSGTRPIDAAGETGVAPTLGAGPVFVQMITDVIDAYRQEGTLASITADARRRPGIEIPDDLRRELEDAADILQGDRPPLTAVQEWVLGAPESPFEPHVELARVWESEEELFAAAQADPDEWPFTNSLHPGDHSTCQCDLIPVVRLDQVEFQRRRDLAA